MAGPAPVSVCHKSEFYQSGWIDRSIWFLARRLSSAYPTLTTLCWKAVLVFPKKLYFYQDFFLKTLDLADCLFSFRHGASIVASVVDLDRLTTVMSLPQWTYDCVYNTMGATQHIARVRLRQLRLVGTHIAPSTPATMSKQYCRMLQVEWFFRQSRNKLNVLNLFRLCFDFVERAKFHEKLVRNCCQNGNIVAKKRQQCPCNIRLCLKENFFSINSFGIVAVCDNKVECRFDKVERCFDITGTAGVDGA